jgi:SPP1 gp7 family putative phage head morphogenesis protein
LKRCDKPKAKKLISIKIKMRINPNHKILFPMAIANQAELLIKQDQRKIIFPAISDIMIAYGRIYSRTDARLPDELTRLLNRLEESAESEARLREIQSLAQQLGRVFETNNRIQVERQVNEILGINLGGLTPRAQKELDKYIQGNVRFIKKLGGTTKRKVRDVVQEAFIDRVGPETLQERLLRRVAVSESHAALIARDQGNKFFGALTKARHLDLGAKKYAWVTSQDERVRTSHALRNGREFYYNNPPSDGNPGEPIQCRCTSVPIFPKNLALGLDRS